ncbi:GNAT family N-acetyltransferase [Actinokineospora sp. HUAS TT18]|uniref:GNAT family N-acetyltransferase n=1 Tax=Actinokineospora sp. HUAS TT18 TaxID=3447451 RepID=UPI003F521827
MAVTTYEDPADFWRTAGDWLERDPVGNTVAITLLRQRLDLGPADGDEPPLLLTVHDGETVVGAAVQTPPRPLIVAGLPRSTHSQVIDVLDHIPGVTGPRDIAEPFTEAWLAKSGQSIATTTLTRLYELGALTVPDVPGHFRLGTAADLPVAARWWEEFAAELDHFAVPGNGAESIQRALDFDRAIGLWFDGDEPVAMALASPVIAGMSRIGPVYTPPAARGRGYGKAVSAYVAQHARDKGAEHVVLFADLDNPVSNAVYQGIGFRVVTDAVDYLFAERNTLEP